MKPSQFLFSEQNKLKKSTKAIQKSTAELLPIPKQREEQNSMIYSLVQLPVQLSLLKASKEGKEAPMVFPESLVSQHMKLDAKQIIGKNTEIARSLKKLRPIEVQGDQLESQRPKTEQLNGPKLQTYMKKLNDLTNGAFKKTQSHLLFASLESKLGGNQVLALVRIKECKFFNQYNMNNDKIPCLFSWEVMYRKKSLVKTTPKEWKDAQQDLLDFSFRKSLDPCEIILWKIKNNDEKYVGQFDLNTNDFIRMTEVLDYKGKIIAESTQEREMFKTLKQTRAFMGNVVFQLIQLGEYQIPVDASVKIPGSPRTDEEKLRHRIIDMAMAGHQYRWTIDENDQITIEEIQTSTQETTAQWTISEVIDAYGERCVLIEAQFGVGAARGVPAKSRRVIKQKDFDAIQSIIKEIEGEGKMAEFKAAIKNNAGAFGRVRAAAIAAAVEQIGGNTALLAKYLTECPEAVEALLGEDDYGVGEYKTRVAVDQDGQQVIIMEPKYDVHAFGSKSPIRQQRVMRVKEFEAMVTLMKELDQDGTLSNIKQQLKNSAGAGSRVRKAALQAAIESIGGKANELLLYMKDDMDASIMGAFLAEDDYGTFLGALDQVTLQDVPDMHLDTFADDLFKNIARHVRRNDRLRVVVEFLSALEKRPEIYVILSNYSKAPFNDVSKWSELPFLAYFDFRNYEHIMILRKMRNLFKNFKLESSPVYQAIYTAHREAKKAIYFEIPCFPKDMDFEDKKESLVLQGMGWNVLHEVARRHKWEKLHRAFEKFYTWAFEEDVLGNTAMAITLRKAPFDVIETLLLNYPDQFTAAFQEFKTNRPRPTTKQSAARRAFEYAGPFKQNIIHELLSNKDTNQGKLLNLLTTLKESYINLNNENNMQELLEQVSTQNLTPFGHYLARLVQIGKKSDRLQRESSTISFIVKFFQQFPGAVTNSEENQKLLCRLPESAFLLLDAQLEFNWLESLDSIRYLIGEKGDSGQLNKISTLVQQIEQFSYSVNKDDEESVKQLTYYFSVYVYILLEIRRKNSRAFDIVSVNVMNILNQWVKQFADLLVNEIDGNIKRLRNYFIGKTEQVNPEKVLNLFTNFKYYGPLNSLQKGDFTKKDKLIEFLQFVQDSKDEQLAPLIMSLVDKEEMTIQLAAKFGLIPTYYSQAEVSEFIESLNFDNPAEGENVDQGEFDDNPAKSAKVDKSYFAPLVLHILNTFTTYPVEYGLDSQFDKLLNSIDQGTISDWVHKKKISDRILKLKLRKRNDYFMNLVLEEIYKSFLAGKPVITPIEVARFLEKQDHIRCAVKFIDYFKSQKLTKCILLTLKNKSQSSRPYPEALFPLLRAQGQSWMAELDAKTFQEVLLQSSIIGTENPTEWQDQGEVIGGGLDDGHILRQIALNGKYENLQIYLAYIAKAQQENKLIHTKDERVLRYTAEVAELALAQIQGDIRSKAKSFANQEPEDSKEKPIQVKPFLHNDHQPQKKFNNKKEQGPKEQIPRFPKGLNNIRTPVSTIDQLLEMSKNIEEELAKCKLDEEITYNTYSFGKIENQVQKDIALYRYLKSWRQAYLNQNLSCAFTQMDFVDKTKSYKKTLIVLLQSQFKQVILEPSYVKIETLVIVEAALLYGLLTYEQISNIYRQNETEMLTLVEKILSWANNDKFKHHIQKNLAYFIGFMQKAVKQLNLKKLFDDKPSEGEEDFHQPGEKFKDFIQDIYNYASKSKPNDTPYYKLSYEFIVQFDAIHAKDFLGKYAKDAEPIYMSMLTELLNNKYADKVIVQIAKKYKISPRAPATDQMSKFLAQAKNHNVKEFLTANDVAKLISRYGDRFLNVLKELFNKNVPSKELREYLLSEWFNEKLLAGLIESQSTKCYSYILYEVMLKGVFKGNKMILGLKLQELYDKNSSKNAKSSEDNDNAEDAQIKAVDENQESDEKENTQWNVQNLAFLATKLNFYEFFDTVVQFNLKIHAEDDEAGFPSNGAQRFKFMTPEQIEAQIKVFNEYGFTQLGSALKLFQQFKDFTTDQDFEAFFFYKLANPQSNQRLSSQSQQLWTSLIQTRQLEENPTPVFFQSSDNIVLLKMHDFDRGVSFVPNKEKESKRTQPLKPIIPFDAIFGNHPALQVISKFLNDKLLLDTISQVMLKQEGKRRVLAITADDLEDIKITQSQTKSSVDFQRDLIHLFLSNYPQFFRTLKQIEEGSYNEWIVCDMESSLIYFKAQLSINSGEIKQHLDGYLKQVNNYINTTNRRNDDEDGDKPVQQEEEEEMEEYEEVITDDDEQDALQQQEEDEEDEPKPVEPEPLPEFEEEEAPDQDQFVEVQAVNQARKPVSEEKKQQKQKEIEEYKIQLQQWEQRQELKKQSKLDQQAKPKEKKTKTVTRRRPKNQADGQLPKNEFIEKLKSCSTLIQNNVFQTLLNLALTDDKCLHAVHEVFLTWKFINPPKEQLKPDPQIIARLVKEGFKEPFDKKFFEIQEPRFKEYKAAVVADMKAIKDMITQNEFITMTRHRDVFQLLLNNLLQLSHFYIEKPELKNYRLLQKKVAAIPLQQDTKFIQEVRYFYQKKYQNVLIEDLTNKYFENALPHKITDKWIQIFHFIEFHQDLQQQLVKFNQLYFKDIIEWQKLYFRDEVGEQAQINCDTTFNYKIKASNNYEPIVWQQRNWQQADRKVEESWQKHNIEKSENNLIYLFDLTINLIKSTNSLSPYPKAFLSDKYLDDIKKIYKDLDFNRRIKKHAADAEEAFRDSVFTYDFTPFFSKINKDNWDSQDLEDLINKKFLIETFPEKNFIIELRAALNDINPESEIQEFYINNIKYTLWNEKVRPEIKINLVEEPRHPVLFGDMPAYADGKDEQEKSADEKQRQEYCKETNKKYPVPYSNYQPRQRAADYKWSVQNDLTMPEFYPLVNLFNYNFVPDIIKRKEYFDKLDTIIQAKQTIVDLNQYISLLNDFLESQPEVDELTGQVLLQGSEINVPWLIFEENNKVASRQLGIQQHPLYQINYLVDAIQPSFTKLNFKYNTISIAETILTRTIRVIQNTTGKRCKLSTAISLFQDWMTFQRIVSRIEDQFQDDLYLSSEDQSQGIQAQSTFKFFYVEVNEIHINSCYPFKPARSEGLDNVFRFGPTQFFVHSNAVIIRLNVACVTEKSDAILQVRNLKQKDREFSKQSFVDVNGVSQYMSKIVNKEDMLKQLFQKK